MLRRRRCRHLLTNTHPMAQTQTSRTATQRWTVTALLLTLPQLPPPHWCTISNQASSCTTTLRSVVNIEVLLLDSAFLKLISTHTTRDTQILYSVYTTPGFRPLCVCECVCVWINRVNVKQSTNTCAEWKWVASQETNTDDGGLGGVLGRGLFVVEGYFKEPTPYCHAPGLRLL